MGQRSISVGARNDGTVDVDIRDEDDGGESKWNMNNLELDEAEFLKKELTRVIARQKERGFPKAPPEAPQLSPPPAPPAASA